MKVEIVDSYDPISEADLVAFEQERGMQLPADYRAFLLAHNGGKPVPHVFVVKLYYVTTRVPIVRFLGFRKNSNYSFSECLKIYRDRLPTNLLSIARDASGSLECLSISGEDYGKVYFWDHNYEITDGEPDYSNVYLLADSFSEFLNMLYDPDEEEKSD